MIVTAHHDNSANNAMNPDPKNEVRWGELTSQEMMLPWFGVVVDRDVAPENIAMYRPGGFEGRVLPVVPTARPEKSQVPFLGALPIPEIAKPEIVKPRF